MTNNQVEIKVYRNHQEMAEAAAGFVLELAKSAVENRGQFYWVLSGGGTPEPLYVKLAQSAEYASFPWRCTHLFWGDERLVPSDHKESNYGQVMDLLLTSDQIPADSIHQMKGDLEPGEAVADYISVLQQYARGGDNWPRFDLVLLGIGSDGHTASLFPGSISKEEELNAVISAEANYDGRPSLRVSMTPPVFNSARQVMILGSGSGKATAVAESLEGVENKERWPVQRIHPGSGKTIWLLDEAAASKLSYYK